jgi:hypothetical protein
MIKKKSKRQTKPKGSFNQVLFFDLLNDRTGMTDYAIAKELGILRQYYRQYTSGIYQLKVSLITEWFEKLGLDQYDLARMLDKATKGK